jgi:probable F420-dependent oxidoreductase
MIIGIQTPMVIRFPALTSEWEATAEVSDLITIAGAADSLGYDHLTCSEHVAVPVDVAAERGGVYWDPIATLSFLAAGTDRIRLATSVLVLGYHHPLAIAKRYGTLDKLSGGRVVLGVGVGSLREEFDLLGASFADRGRRADDAVRALRAALGATAPHYDGPYYRFDRVITEPTAIQTRVPIWVGGRSMRSLRRATDAGDGWMPFALTPDELATMLKSAEVPDGFSVVAQVAQLDPIGDGDGALARLHAYSEAGATRISVSLRARSASHYVEQLHALAELAQVGAT